MSRPALTPMCWRCKTRYFVNASKPAAKPQRSMSSTASNPAAADDSALAMFEKALRKPGSQRRPPPPPSSSSPFQTNTTTSTRTPTAPPPSISNLESLAQGARNEASTRPSSGVREDEPYHINVYAHKHNMHITFTEPSRNPILSFSAGNIGLRKAQRGTFDAAYQLSTYTMRKMAEKQWRTGGKGMTANPMLTLNEVEVRDRGIEVVMRGYGPGREAFQKALLGNEGKIIKPLIKKVTDGTRLKFGGTRSPQVRRLG